MTTADDGRRTARDERREQRAHRILDAAGELDLRWGYDKTTVDDIARSAGVAKGTIYLHWKTREELYVALLRRERVRMLDAVGALFAAETDPGTPRRALQLACLELFRRPLLRASLTGDSEVLGQLVRRKARQASDGALLEVLSTYVERMRAVGVLRADLTPAELSNVITATAYGFVWLTPMLQGALAVDDERRAELLADTIVRATSSGAALSDAEASDLTAATADYVEAIAVSARDKLRAVLPETPTTTTTHDENHT